MKRTLISKIPFELGSELERFVLGAPIYDSSCNSDAKVYFVDKREGYFLKVGKKGSLYREAEMTRYFNSKGLGAEVISYASQENDLLLTKRVVGEDCTYEKYLANPTRLCDILATTLRKLHEIDFRDCPITDKMQEYFASAEKNYRLGEYDKSHFPDSFGYRSAEDAYAVFQSSKAILTDKVLLHGDYCLPNVILNDWKFSGFIDVGQGGVGDRHVDVFWGIWTLGFNLKTNAYRNRFLDAYGRDLIDEEKLKVIGAIEVFG